MEQRRKSAILPSQGVTEGDSGAWSDGDAPSESDGSDVDTYPSARGGSAQSLPSSNDEQLLKSSKIKPPRASNGNYGSVNLPQFFMLAIEGIHILYIFCIVFCLSASPSFLRFKTAALNSRALIFPSLISEPNFSDVVNNCPV